MAEMRIVPISDGSITSVPGYAAAGVAAGIKADGALDVALVCSEGPCVGAALFTRNLFKAAPVLYDQDVLASNRSALYAVLINSGCANACTGEKGLADAKESARLVAEGLHVEPEGVLVMSTGVIGQHLPMDKLARGVVLAGAELSKDIGAGHRAARAIMTTDTCPKEAAVRVETANGSAGYTVAGMAKGAGMIHPDMATMLSVIVTDAAISEELAQRALGEAANESFNMISVDGDMSTNDTVVLLASRTSECSELGPIVDASTEAYTVFVRALTEVATSLAKGLVRDGEGATRFVEITVTAARSRQEAKQVAMSVATSSLVKTAIYGRDANWGRIVCAVGYAGVDLDPNTVRVWLGDLELVRDGAPYDVDEERASAILAQEDISIRIALGQGAAQATVWTSDLSHEYVDINAHYRT